LLAGCLCCNPYRKNSIFPRRKPYQSGLSPMSISWGACKNEQSPWYRALFFFYENWGRIIRSKGKRIDETVSKHEIENIISLIGKILR
jgi:hypothetical protein